MASFSERLKAANAAVPMVSNMVLGNEDIAVTSIEQNVDIMTLEEPYDGLAYSGEEWILSTKYGHTIGNDYGKSYEDSNYATVDEFKTVTVSPTQVNLTQEDNSQYIPFEMFRYYDGIDLMNMMISIYFVNEENGYKESDVINVEYSDTKIRFGWVVPKEATAIAGRLQFEIHATGINPLGYDYLLKTRPNSELNIEKSLQGDGQIIVNGEEWATNVVEEVVEAAEQAKAASNLAKGYADDANKALTTMKTTISTMESDITEAVTDNVSGNLDTLVDAKMGNYYIKEETYSKAEIDDIVEGIDVTEQLGDYALKNEIPVNVSQLNNDAGYLTEHQSLEGYATETFVTEELKKVDVTAQLNILEQKIADEYYDIEEVNQKIQDIDVSDQVYTKSQSDEKYASKSVEATVSEHTTSIQTANTAIATINATLDSIDKSPNAYYITTYNEPYTFEGTEYTGENTLVVYEIYNKDKENESRTVVAAHVIQGGSGSGSSNTIVIERITNSPLVVTSNDDVIIEYNFIGTDTSGEDISQGNATWKLGNQVVKTEKIYTGENFVDLTDYINIGSDQKVTLIITDDIGTIAQKSWYVSVIDVKLTSTFDDSRTYTANSPVTFTYTPYGAIDKTVHILMDGNEIDTITSSKSATGLSTSYTIPAQSHGTHLFEIYMTATVNNNDIESNHIVKDIIWYDETSTLPLIGCISQKFTARQYEATNVVYTVYDPSTETPNVTLKATYVNEDGEVVETYNSNITMSSNTETWQFKTDIIGEHTLTITCGETVKTLKATIVDLGIEVNPTTAGLEFDFNPVGYSNNDENRIWKDINTGVSMTVSDNFDWINGGYQIDDAGDQYFCIKAGTTATINYNLFSDDAKVNGKEFKAIFKTTNVKNRNTSFITCMDYGIGLDMKVESANIYSSNGSLYSPYCEEDIIEFEFNINKNTDIPMVMTYEDGVGNRPMIYTSDSSFWQTNATPITIGSNNCDVHIYRMKAYSTSLSDKDILNNFIADARNAEEMLARHERNQIYKDGELDPEYLAEMCPDLRIIMIDAPWFTNDKDNKVTDTNITMIYKNGDPILDNWTCTGATHRGQGTSSNEYGYASRNIDLVMDTDTSLFTLGDGVQTSSTITLTRNSVPTDYLNIKVNVASSEHANNAQMVRNYSLFNPFIRFARWKDSRVKDCMEFFNCVVFIKERDTDISTHREFQDCNYHFYSIGNIGDSKKTDDTRVNDKNDPKEHVVEITDYNVPLAEFPTGKDGICPESEWKTGNAAYDFLYSEYEYEDGEFKSFGAGSYEFRYEKKGITNEQRQDNIDTWREMYKFIVTSPDEEFYVKLKEWFVVDSALYYYLFTERYTMVDNRAKNSFWHYGKVYISNAEAITLGEDAGGYIIDDVQASIRNGYRYDLTFCYDCDTSLGIDNTGKLVLTYGKEDTDFYVDSDSTSGYIYRAAESTFFCRIRDLFASELQAMFVDRENQNTWSSSRLLKQWDDSQNQFPEELWRLHIQRVYLRTYQGISIDNSFAGEANPRFLTEMMNGRKKYQRRMFERNQELYMATKYFGKVATQDQIMMRFNNPVGAVIPPDFTLYITPYSDMYIGTSFGNVTPTNFRAKAGIEYTIPCSIESGTADITLIYGASFIQAIGDLSKCYVGDNDFSKASRLQRLVIGSNIEGYNNSFMTKISLGNNKLLEYLDVQNITGLNSVIDLSECGNLLELHAEGSGATGVIFANGGKLQKAYLPAITSLTMKNLSDIEEFVVENYDNLQTLIVEHTPFINTLDIVNAASLLRSLRLVGINWNMANSTVLDRLLLLRGVDNLGGEIVNSILTGDVYVTSIKEYNLYKYQDFWQDLTITYGAMTRQYVVTFVNHDGTVLDVQYIDMNGDAVDPITREDNPISIPVKDNTVSTIYTFAGWDSGFTNIGNNKTIKALYTESVRQYSVKYVQVFDNITYVLQSNDKVNYGTYYFYEGDIPTYTGQEGSNKFYLFNSWDKSGYVDGDKEIIAIYDECNYSNDQYFVNKPFEELKPVELYALSKLIESGKMKITKDNSGFDYIENTDYFAGDAYSFTMGNDYNFADLEDKTYTFDNMFPRTFTGVNGDYYDTGINVLDADKDFVLAVDYEFDPTNTNERSVLMDCFVNSSGNGFRLSCDVKGSTMGNPTINWYNNSKECAVTSNREMLVIRHVAGDTGLYVYTSNLSGTSVNYYSLDASTTPTTFTFSLIFGCGRQSGTLYNYYAKGTIHWAKLWYADLGDQACRNLAAYIHENIGLKISGFYRQFLTEDENILVPISFIGSHVLYTKRGISSSSTNENGWAGSSLNTWLNNRFYEGLPIQIKQLIRQVNVKSTAGKSSTSIVSSPCYIYIPSVSELVNASPYYDAPYTNEVDGVPVCIPYFKNAEDRIMYDANNVATTYWTRSPYATSSSYYLYIQENGAPYQFAALTTNRGIVVEFSI